MARASKENLQRTIPDAVKRVTEDYAKYSADSNKDIGPKIKVLLSSGYSINGQATVCKGSSIKGRVKRKNEKQKKK